MARFFKKELVSNPIRFNGEKVKWELVGGNTGIRQLDEEHDKALIAELDRLADARKMGVVRINADIAAELKKKAREMKSPPPLADLQRVRIANRDLFPTKPKSVAPLLAAKAAATNSPAVQPPPPPAENPAAQPEPPRPVRRANRSAVTRGPAPLLSVTLSDGKTAK